MKEKSFENEPYKLKKKNTHHSIVGIEIIKELINLKIKGIN